MRIVDRLLQELADASVQITERRAQLQQQFDYVEFLERLGVGVCIQRNELALYQAELDRWVAVHQRLSALIIFHTGRERD
jgi:hypothetical protein